MTPSAIKPAEIIICLFDRLYSCSKGLTFYFGLEKEGTYALSLASSLGSGILEVLP